MNRRLSWIILVLAATGCSIRKSPEEFRASYEKNARVIVVAEKLPVVYERTLKFSARCMQGATISQSGMNSMTRVTTEILADRTHIIRVKLDANASLGSTVDSFAAIAEISTIEKGTQVKIYGPSRNKYLKKAFERWAKNESDACPDTNWY